MKAGVERRGDAPCFATMIESTLSTDTAASVASLMAYDFAARGSRMEPPTVERVPLPLPCRPCPSVDSSYLKKGDNSKEEQKLTSMSTPTSALPSLCARYSAPMTSLASNPAFSASVLGTTSRASANLRMPC